MSFTFSDKMTSASDMIPAMTPLLDLSRSVLWHWKTFPIILPPPITLQADQNQGQQKIVNSNCKINVLGSMCRKKTINIRDLFIEPNFNELEAVSTDSKGGPKKLNQAQLESLRRTGEFQVSV